MPAQVGPDWPLFSARSPREPGRLTYKPKEIRYLDVAPPFTPLSCAWHCLFRRQAQPGHHFRSPVQLGTAKNEAQKMIIAFA